MRQRISLRHASRWVLLLAVATLGAVAASPRVQAQPGGGYPYCPTDFASLGTFVAAGTVVFDTTALTYGGLPGGVDHGGVAVYCFDSVDVPSGATVVGVGSRPLVILSRADVNVEGVVSLDGTSPGAFGSGPCPGGAGGGAGGPGENPGSGPGAGSPPTLGSRSGAGGGGFGGFGGDGGANSYDGAPGGAGGAPYGDLSVQLEGGSGGAGGSIGAGSTTGGGGGGALYMGALGSISIFPGAEVRANGGNGDIAPNGASGGGSGGAIVLTAPGGVLNEGVVRADGGAGGMGGCCGSGGGGGGGHILVAATSAGSGTYSVAGGVSSPFGSYPGVDGSAGVLTFDPNALPPCDTTPPTLTVSITRTTLWPATRGLIDVGLGVTATDNSGVAPTVVIDVWSDEPNGAAPYSPDATVAGTVVRCRAERDVTANGRVYLIRVRATDAAGNLTTAARAVVVPLSITVVSLSAVAAQSASAVATCTTTGNAPPGWFLVGD